MPLEEVLAGCEEVVSHKMQSKIQYLKEKIETVRSKDQAQSRAENNTNL